MYCLSIHIWYARLVWTVVTLISICAPAAALKAETKITETVKYYIIYPQNPADLRQALEMASPVFFEGKTYFGYTDSRIGWYLHWYASQQDCRPTGADITVEITTTLPKLSASVTDKETSAKFNRFLQALILHESGHRDIAMDAARQIEHDLTQLMPRAKCADLAREAELMVQKILDAHDRIGREYDERTRYGATQGALIP